MTILTILGWLKLVPRWAYAALGVVAGLLLLWHIHSGWERKAYNDAFNAGWTKQKVQTDAEIRKNAINLTSIGNLQADLADKNAESDARAKAFADAKAADDADRAALAKQYASSQAARDALQAMAKVAGSNPACKVPMALTGALEGL